MSLIDESASAPGGIKTALDAGIDSIDRFQKVTFTQYTKSTIPTDGYVFWVKGTNTLTVNGSLHYSSDVKQNEDETIGLNEILFTSQQEVTQFNTISPSTMWIGDWPVESGATIKIAFSKRTSYYAQADIWHYSGFAVYPALSAQLVASSADLPVGPIVSNSLPIWLGQSTVSAPIYASYLVPDNIVPPYVTAHIEPEGTRALQPFPVYQWTTSSPAGSALAYMTSSQLMQDRVRLTLYGFTNETAIQFAASLMDYSLNMDEVGFCSNLEIRDDKRIQSEITAIAQKKTMDFLCSYYQGTADAIARRLILSTSVNYTV